MSRLVHPSPLCSYGQQVSILKVTGWVKITMRQFMNNKALYLTVGPFLDLLSHKDPHQHIS